MSLAENAGLFFKKLIFNNRRSSRKLR